MATRYMMIVVIHGQLMAILHMDQMGLHTLPMGTLFTITVETHGQHMAIQCMDQMDHLSLLMETQITIVMAVHVLLMETPIIAININY